MLKIIDFQQKVIYFCLCLYKFINMHVKTIQDDGEMYRNKGGTLLCGKIVKGTLSQAQMKLRVSSIPNKYENVIYQSNSKSAFGTTKHYFYNNEQNINTPGPGCYNPVKDLPKSQSKKGSGFFASKSKMKTLQGSRNDVPGPGSYSVSKFEILSTQRYSSSANLANNRKKKSSGDNNFRSDQLFKKQLLDAKQKPGVGTYNVNPEQLNKNNKKSSIFKSSVDRFNTDREQVPAPGIYEISKINQNNSHTKKKQSFSRQESENQRQKRIIEAIKGLETGNNKQVLGPGSYNPALTNTSKSFKIIETIYDRFGNLKSIYDLAKNTQPAKFGQHEKQSFASDPSRRRLLSTFISSSKKWDIVLQNQMDPGKYSSSKSFTKKSHLVNFGQKWV